MSGESNTFGFNPNKQKFERVETDGEHALKVFQVNSSSGGASSTIIKGNDGNDGAGTDRTIKTNANGELLVVDSSSNTIKGNDGNDGAGTDRTIKTNANGELLIVNTDNVIKGNDGDNGAGSSTTIKTNSIGELITQESKITIGNSTISAGGSLQSVLMYGRKANGDLEPLECSGDRLLVDVVELAQSGPISTSTSMSSVQVCAYNESDVTKFRTLKAKSDGTLRTEAAVTGNSGGSQVQMLVDPAGNVNTMPREPTRANLQISAANISTWNNDASTDLVSMGNYSLATIYIAFVSSSMSQDDGFVVEGTDDDSNFYPIAVLRPLDGRINNSANTNDIIKASLYIPFAKFRIQNKTGSAQPLLNNDGAFYQLHDSSSDHFAKDTQGALLISSNIVRGVISVPSPTWTSGTLTSTAIDMGHHKTLNFHIEGMSNSHSGIIVHGSNDNSTYVKSQLFTPSDVGPDTAVRGSLTRGFRFFKFENAGIDFTTTGTTNTFNHYD